MVLGAKYLVSSGLFHVWQQLRALRIDLLERLGRVRPYERKLRLAARELQRQGVVDWTAIDSSRTSAPRRDGRLCRG
jgi:hypothetical protein